MIGEEGFGLLSCMFLSFLVTLPSFLLRSVEFSKVLWFDLSHSVHIFHLMIVSSSSFVLFSFFGLRFWFPSVCLCFIEFWLLNPNRIVDSCFLHLRLRGFWKFLYQNHLLFFLAKNSSESAFPYLPMQRWSKFSFSGK